MKSIYEQFKKDSRYNIASKVWFKTFPFRVSFKGWDMFDDGFLNNFHRNTNIRNAMTKLKHPIRFRNDHNFHIYLTSTDAVQDIIKLFDKQIVEIAGPANQEHHDVMTTDLTHSVRKNLFYQKYRYKVSAKLYRYESNMDIFEEILDFITGSLEPETYFINSTIKNYPRIKALEEESRKKQIGTFGRRRWTNFLPFSATGSVYLTNYDDVCTLHLMYKSVITSTTKVILLSELE